MSSPECWFCGGASLECVQRGLYHPAKRDHGPFEFDRCAGCGSGITPTPPTREQLAALYGSFRDGLPDLQRSLAADDPQVAWYARCAKRVTRLSGRTAESEFRWVDVGAGGGELSVLLAERFPRSRGTALDLHPRPASLTARDRVDWLQRDVNGAFSAGLPRADVVVSTAVWEHVLRPDLFVREALELLSPGGLLYLICPNYDSLASRLLGARWPYFTPGEHLHMPSPEGARRCLERAWSSLQGAPGGVEIASRPIFLPYTLRYVLRRFGMEKLGRLMPAALHLPLPVGALESVARRRAGEAAA